MTAGTRDVFAWKERDASKPPPFLRYRSSYLFILSTICIAVFTDIFLYGLIVPVIPFALTSRAGVAQENVQYWTSVLLAVYGAALLASSPICGWLADRTASRRLPLLIGLLALAGATLLLMLGKSIVLLVIGRLLQGISAAIVWTVGLALLVDTVGHDVIGQAVGYVSISMSIAVLLAPLLGGIVYARAGYFAVYSMALALIIVDILLRVALVEKKVAKKWDITLATPLPEHFDKSSIRESLPTYLPPPPPSPPSLPSPPSPSLNVQDHFPTIPPPPKTPNPRSPIVTLLTSRRLLAALYCTLTQSILVTAWDAVLPLYTSHLFDFTSLGAGLIFLPLILPSFLAPLVGHWADKRGPRVPTTLGFISAIPFLVLLRYVNHSGTGQIVLLCALFAFIGLAITNAMTPLLAEITYVVGHKERTNPEAFGGKGAYATAYGLFNMAFAGGMLVGPLWGGFVVGKAGWGTLGWSLGVASLGGGVVSALWVGGWIGEKRRGEGKVERSGEGV